MSTPPDAGAGETRLRPPMDSSAEETCLRPPADPVASQPPPPCSPDPAARDACGPSTVPPADAGVSFGRYRLLRELGRGAMGVVYAAWDPELRRQVALKRLRAPATAGDDAGERFLREARAAGRLQHPNVVPIHDVGEHAGEPFFTMELVEGTDLERAAGSLDPRRFLQVLRDAALGLEAAHAQGIVHRDVKPANVLIDSAGRPRVTDFGLAKEVRAAAGRGATADGALLGTPYYMSPEQAEGQTAAVGPATDVWSLGVILYEHLAGRKPFVADTVPALLGAIARDEPDPPSRVPGARRVARDLETVCLKCLEKAPSRRYSRAGDLAADLACVLAGEPVSARPVRLPERLLRRVVRRPALAAAGLVVLGLALALATALQRAHQRAQADEWLARAESLGRDAKDVLYRAELPIERHQAKVREALGAFDRAQAGCPDYGWIFESRGRLWLRLNRLREAEQDLVRAAALLDPDDAKCAHRALVRVCMEEWLERGYRSGNRLSATETADRTRWLERTRREREAALGAPEGRDGPEEAEAARLLMEGYESLLRRDAAGAETAFRNGLKGGVLGEEFAWALSTLTQGPARREWLDHAIRLRPRFPRALTDRAFLALRERRFAAAIADCDEALHVDPSHTRAWGIRAGARSGAGDVAGAWTDNEEMLRLDPTQAYAYTLRGVLRHHAGDLEGALADFEIALRLEPESADAYHDRGIVRFGRGEMGPARADYERALSLDPTLAEAHYSRGLWFDKSGDSRAALEDFSKAIALVPGLTGAWVERARIREIQGETPAAIADLTEAIRLEPANATAWYRRGKLRRFARDPGGAMADCREALRLQADSEKALTLQGLLYQDAGNHPAALEVLSTAARMAPRDAVIFYNRANSRWALGDREGARADFDASLGLDPGNFEAWLNRGALRCLQGDPTGAIADADAALKIDPRSPIGWFNRAAAERQKGDVDAAITDLRRVLEVAPPGWPHRGAVEATLKELGTSAGGKR